MSPNSSALVIVLDDYEQAKLQQIADLAHVTLEQLVAHLITAEVERVNKIVDESGDDHD